MSNLTIEDLTDLLSMLRKQRDEQQDMPETFRLVELEKKIESDIFTNYIPF